MRIMAKDYKANDLIRMIREYTGLSQKEFAKQVNRSVHTIQAYEQGRRSYNIETLLDITRKCKLKIIIES